MRKTYSRQWELPGRPQDPQTRVWTHVSASCEEIMGLLGLAPGSAFVSVSFNTVQQTVTLTAEEPLEAICLEPSGSELSDGPVIA